MPKINEVEEEDIKFVQACPPPLESGEYKISITQEVDAAGGKPLPPSENGFSIKGPRFVLGGDDVYAAFPPPDQIGGFSNVLPHIVLNRRSLPWERDISGGTVLRMEKVEAEPINVTPWLALFVFSQAELTLIETEHSDKNYLDPVNGTVNDILNPPSGILAPTLTLDEYIGETPDSPCIYIDIPKDLYLKIAPNKNELQYLCHSRYVDRSAKETGGLNDDGWYSCVIGNRFPGSSAGGEKNVSHLLSLEGFGEYLPGGGGTLDSSIDTIRLISLASWQYSVQTQEYNFRELVTNLSPAEPISIPFKDGLSGEGAEEVKSALNMGYAALTHNMKAGEETVSWYRGPFLPLAMEKTESKVHPTSDELIKYDPETGMFDVSYAVAWQLGRLLALHNKHFASDLFNWRRLHNQQLIFKNMRKILKDRLQKRMPVLQGASDSMGDTLFREAVFDFWSKDMHELFVSGKKLEGLKYGDPTGMTNRIEEYDGVVEPEEIKEILSMAKDGVKSLKDKVFGGK